MHVVETRNPIRQAVKAGLMRTLPDRFFTVSRPRSEASVYLTFDDGPHPEHTPAVLDALAAREVTATFFVIGQNAALYPDLIRRIAEGGHTVGHHSYYHTEPGQTSAPQLLGEVQRSVQLLGELLGEPPRLFRPPHGKLTAKKLYGLAKKGQVTVLWNVDPKDYCAPNGAAVSDWVRDNPLTAGDIVLLHDNHPMAAEALPTIIDLTRDRGLGLRAIRPSDF